jgi:hypothetical protein
LFHWWLSTSTRAPNALWAHLPEIIRSVFLDTCPCSLNVGDDTDDGVRLAEAMDVASSSGFFTTVNINHIESLLLIQLLKYGDDSLVHWLYYRYGVGRQELNLHMFIETGNKMADDLRNF